MGAWSSENATKAYLKTMELRKNPKEPNGAEFISALAAGNNAQLVIVACATVVDDTTLALVAAVQQTGGRVICIFRGQEELNLSEKIIGRDASQVEFVVGDAEAILLNHYNELDFVAIDCNLENYDGILRSIRGSSRQNNTIVLGYNAFCKESWRKSDQHSQLLPIGDGLLLTRIAANYEIVRQKRSLWIVTVDKCTGEEHVFRVRYPHGRVIGA